MAESKCDCDPLTRYCSKCYKNRCKCDTPKNGFIDICYKCCECLCGCMPPTRFCAMCVRRDEIKYDINAPLRICMRYHERYEEQNLYKCDELRSASTSSDVCDAMDLCSEKCRLYLERNIKDSPDDDEKM